MQGLLSLPKRRYQNPQNPRCDLALRTLFVDIACQRRGGYDMQWGVMEVC